MRNYEEFQKMFDHGTQGYLVTSLPFSSSSVIFYVNPAAGEMLGFPCSELCGRTLSSLFPVLCSQTAGMNVGPFYHTAGNQLLRLFASPFGEDACLCFLLDQNAAEQEAADNLAEYQIRMSEALDAANAANQAKTNFLSEMSHDIRTPMNAIIGMTDIALNYSDDPARVEDCLKKIRTASGHLMELINEVLDMSRIESGKVVLNEEHMQLADQIHEILVIIRPQIAAKKQTFHLDLDSIHHENLIADSTRIRQIFLNILSNAVKYTPEGGDIRMTLRQEQLADSRVLLTFTVKDNGIGMTNEFMENIFQPFERESSSTISRIEGTGLGMTITKKLIEMMGGTITVTSELHRGSTFTVAIPFRLSEADTSFLSTLSGRHVLVILGDDNKLGELPQLLGELGITCDVAADGNQAINAINDADISGAEYFALLTADHLADIDISQLLPDIRARKGGDFPILMLSENSWSELEYLMTRIGVSAFIPLPLFKSRLAEALYPFTQEGNREAEAESRNEVADYSSKHLLLVEDNMLNLEIAKEILSMTSIQIDTATNGEEAVAAFLGKPLFYYDLILMDIKMPVMDGLEATKHIRALSRADAAQVPIVAMTANAFEEDRQISLNAGMNAHITKPLDVEQVLGCLDRLRREKETHSAAGSGK